MGVTNYLLTGMVLQVGGQLEPVSEGYTWPNGIIFHQPHDFPEIFGNVPSKTLPFGGNRSCEVVII